MNLLNFLFRANGSTPRNMAKERLRLVLMQDRTSLPSDLIDKLREDLIRVISKHVNVERDDIEVAISRHENYNTLVVNVPFQAAKKSVRKYTRVGR